MFSDNPRIGMISWDFHPPIGGMGRHVQSLVSGLRKATIDVHVFSRNDAPSLRVGRNLSFSFFVWLKLNRWIRLHQIDLLHVHTGPGGVLLVSKPSVPLIVTANHTYAQQSKIKGQGWKRLLALLERRTLQYADHIICLSPDTALSVQETYGIDSAKITVIPCSVDVSRLQQCDLPLEKRKNECVFIGRPDTRKGFDLLSEAWNIVIAKIPDARLRVIGWEEQSMDSMTFQRNLSDQELGTVIGSAHMVICPSRLEGFGLAAAEAIAAGTPVVATNVDGLRSVVQDQKTGLLTNIDLTDIAEKITMLFSDHALWERLHQGCQLHRNVFLPEMEIIRHVEIYKRCLADFR